MTSVDRASKLAVAVVFASSFVLLGLLMDRELLVFDEGLVLVNAMRTLAGDVIHRDYNSSYGPGAYGALAMLFAILEPSFVVARAYGLLIMAGIVTTTFALLVTRTRPIVCYAFTAICAGWMLASNYYLYPLLPSLLLALMGSGLLLASDSPQRTSLRVLAGCCTGAVALFRYDTGFIVMVAQLVALALQKQLDGAHTRRGMLRAVTPFVAGVSLVFVPFALAYIAVAPLSAFVQDIIDYPLKYYAEMRGLPFPGIRQLALRPHHVGVYMPFVALLLAAFACAGYWRFAKLKSPTPSVAAFKPERRDFDFLVLFALLAAFGCYKSAARVENVHMLLAIIPAGLVLAVLTDRAWTLGGRARILASLTFLTAFIPAGLAAEATLSLFAHDPDRMVAGHVLGLSRDQIRETQGGRCAVPPRLKGARLPDHYSAAARYLLEHTATDEPVFVGLDRHDRIFANAVALYYAAERNPGTHWHQFDPGLQTREDIQKEIVSDLQHRHVRWVVRDSGFQNHIEPNGSRLSSGVHVLDRWLDANYRPVMRIPPVEIWLHNSSTPPSQPGDPCQLP
jgi:hypothetical protein